MIYDKYSIHVDFGSGYEQVTPINDDFVFSNQKNKEWGYYRRLLDTVLDFCKEDYQKLLALEKSCNRCDKIPIRIDACDEIAFYEGYLNLNKGNWDEDNCNVLIKPTIDDEYSCLFENWKVKRNILRGTDKVTVNQLIGEIECLECEDGSSFGTSQNTPAITGGVLVGDFIAANDCLPDPNAWTCTGNEVRYFSEYETVGGLQPPKQTYSKATWCREKYTGTTPPPGTWIQISGNGWVRELDLGCDVQYELIATTYHFTAPPANNRYSVSTYLFECPVPELPVEFDNGVTLGDIFDAFLQACEIDVCSDFFNINPDNTAPSNIPYMCAGADLMNLVLFQKTDIKNADAFQNASIGKLSFEDFFKILAMFNIEFWIEDGKLRIEHVSYKESFEENGIDLVADYLKCIEGFNQYSYDSFEIPQIESFSWMDDVRPYFEGEDILYEGGCVEIGEEEAYNFTNVSTDVNYIANNEAINNDGFVLMSTIDFNGQLYLNNNNTPLSWTELHECYWRHNRPQFDGNMNEQDTCFESAERLKTQKGIEFPLCCEDFIDFNPQLLINTQVGWGEIEQYSYSAKTGYITVDLRHEQEKCC